MSRPLVQNSHWGRLRLSLVVISLILLPYCHLWSQTETLVATIEAESGTRSGGVVVASSHAGYTGTGYVTNFRSSADKITVNVNVAVLGYYRVKIRYSTTGFGNKNQWVFVNNNVGTTSVLFQGNTGYDLANAGKYLLNAGNNTITVQSEWGWMDVDNFMVYSITVPELTFNIAPTLINSHATESTKALYAFLVNNFNNKIISGQTNDWYDKIKPITGKSPMLRAFDFQHYTQGYPYKWSDATNGWVFGAEDDGQVQTAIDWYNQTGGKGIVTFQWHWHSPSGGTIGTNTFYSDQTTFDVNQAVIGGTTENTLILQDIDAIAAQLKRLQDANVPVLWRPLHEAGGAWFWWGEKGATACLQLFNILFDRLTNLHGLNNLIWVWSTPETAWYPGNSKIDIVGHDSYPGAFNYDAKKNDFDVLYNLTGGTKLIAMTENGPIPNPDDCLALDAPWSFFMSWGDLVAAQNSNQHIIDVYNNPNVLTLETVTSEIPNIGNNPKFVIYPNPARDIINIEAPLYSQIEMTDTNGNKVFTSNDPISGINVKMMSPGLYIIRIFAKDGWKYAKVIIKK